jgi:hypothetical protein
MTLNEAVGLLILCALGVLVYKSFFVREHRRVELDDDRVRDDPRIVGTVEALRKRGGV